MQLFVRFAAKPRALIMIITMFEMNKNNNKWHQVWLYGQRNQQGEGDFDYNISWRQDLERRKMRYEKSLTHIPPN